ncbi:MAG: TolC family protein [candidate division KSB1 bacterium]|nr:TolC family protein [candidate division KSB1 bacterium]
MWEKVELFIILFLVPTIALRAQSARVLTLEESLNIALGKSYQVKQLEQSLINSRMSLKAAEASFKSNGQLAFSSLPNLYRGITATSIGTGEVVFPKQNYVDLQAELYVNQPISATDGVFSLVGVMQRFHQTVTTPISFGGINFEQKTSTTNYTPQLRLQFRQPLFTYNKLKTGFQRARLNLENTMQAYTRNQLDIIYNVTTNYYNLLRAQRQAEIDREQVKQSENAYRIAGLKQQAGLLPEVEVLRLEVELANARNSAAASEANLKQNEDAFKILIGLPIEEAVQVAAELDYRPIVVSVERALSEALKRRTELRSDEINVQLRELDVREIDAQSEIKGDLFLRYGIFNTEKKFNEAFQNFDNDRSVKFALNVPLWDWGKNGAEVQAAQASLESDRLMQKNRYDLIKQEIRAAVRNLQSAQQRLEITQRSEELAEKSYKISLLKFESGDLSSQDLALEQNRLTQARTNSLNAIIDYKQALADLRRKTLWDFEKDEPVRIEVPK